MTAIWCLCACVSVASAGAAAAPIALNTGYAFVALTPGGKTFTAPFGGKVVL